MERIWLIGGGTALAVLLVASVIVALMREEAEFEPGSSELAVQQYLKALVQNDFETAEAMWSSELREDCSFERFRLDAKRSLGLLSEARITLDDVHTVGETTIVSVRVTQTTGGGIFGPSEREHSYEYGVRSFDGDWRITGHTWPADRCVSRAYFGDEPPPPTTTPGRLD